MKSSSVSISYTDALERALGGVIARAQGELVLLRAQADARLAELEARIQERLASLQDGEPGASGASGKDGERGPEGPPGKLQLARAWVAGVHYEGAVVTHDGAAFQALRDTGVAPPHDDWICLAQRGRDGNAGRTFAIRGTWSAEDEYRELDVVMLNGASFAARQDAPGACPGDGWQLIAAQGKRGKPGEAGPRGEPGSRGVPGSPIIAADIDEEGLLRLTNGDGSTVICDFYPLLSKFAK